MSRVVHVPADVFADVLCDEVCSIDGCEKRRRTKGFCSMHYERQRRFGDPHRERVAPSFEERLFARLDVGHPLGCWLWTGVKNSAGYGQIGRDRKTVYVHRAMYELLRGPIPKGYDLDHLCRVRRCANPDHLEPVTRAENALRGVHPTMRAVRLGQCVNGHPMTTANTYIRPDGGGRQCRECILARTPAWKRAVFCDACDRPTRYLPCEHCGE